MLTGRRAHTYRGMQDIHEARVGRLVSQYQLPGRLRMTGRGMLMLPYENTAAMKT